MFNRWIKWAVCLLGAASISVGALAQQWPSKPIILIIPFPPGGSTDTIGRLMANRLSTELGQSVIVENRGGAGGNIAAEAASRAAPDGYTMFLMTSSHVANMSLYKKLSYNLLRDFEPVAQVAIVPNVLAVGQAVPVQGLADFVKLVRDPQSKVNYGSAGNGSSLHLAGALFNNSVNGHMVHVPYKGGGPAYVDLLGGQIQATFAPVVDLLPYIKAGRLKALGVTTKARSPLLPQVPAIGESLPGYEIALWNGLLVPAKTPPEIVNKLSETVARILRQPDVRQLLADQGCEPVGSTPAEFGAFMASEVPKWRSVVQVSGASAD